MSVLILCKNKEVINHVVICFLVIFWMGSLTKKRRKYDLPLQNPESAYATLYLSDLSYTLLVFIIIIILTSLLLLPSQSFIFLS